MGLPDLEYGFYRSRTILLLVCLAEKVPLVMVSWIVSVYCMDFFGLHLYRRI